MFYVWIYEMYYDKKAYLQKSTCEEWMHVWSKMFFWDTLHTYVFCSSSCKSISLYLGSWIQKNLDFWLLLRINQKTIQTKIELEPNQNQIGSGIILDINQFLILLSRPNW